MDNVTTPPAVRRKTKPKGRHPHKALSAAFVRSAPPGGHCDGNGLYLYVQRTGTRSWIQRLVIRGRKPELGLGSVALVSLAEAREQALANRKLARAGGDPLAEKRRSVGIPTFAEAAQRVAEQKRAGWRSSTHPRHWFRSLELHAFPRIGGVPVSEVTSADVLEILTPLWHTKGRTARYVHLFKKPTKGTAHARPSLRSAGGRPPADVAAGKSSRSGWKSCSYSAPLSRHRFPVSGSQAVT